MESRDRVIVIDLSGDNEEAVKTAEKAAGHECRCGVCTCREQHEPEQLELQLQSYGLPSKAAVRPGRGLPSIPARKLLIN